MKHVMQWFSALVAALFAPATRHRRSFIFADTVTVEQLQERLTQLTAQARALQETADRENRPLSAEETQQIEDCLAAFDATEADIKRRQRLAASESRLQAPGVRKTDSPPAPVAQVQPGNGNAMEVRDGARLTGGMKPGATNGTCGFVSTGEFAMCVKAAVGGNIDPRLRIMNATASPATEGSGSEGGYLIPPDFRTNIMTKVFGEDSLLPRTDQQQTSSTSITIPVDETTPWQTSGGIQVFWEGEGSSMGQSKPALNNVTVRAHKLAAIVAVTDELLEDAPSLTAYLNRKVPEKMQYKVNDALLNGDGVGKPQGVMKAKSLVTVSKEGSQAADTLLYQNVEKMWSRMYAPCRRNAVWIMNQDMEPQLSQMVFPGGSGTGTVASGYFPAYMPANGLRDGAPNGTLKGRPIIYTEAAGAIGDLGDVMLVDFTQYLSLVKGGGMKSDVSIHLWFDQGITAFRYTLRIGGQCWWAGSITRAKSSLPLGCCVTLEAR